MNNFSTPSWHDLTFTTLKQSGSEYSGPCPVTGEGKDRFHIDPDHETMGCRGCGDSGSKLVGAPFKEHLAALGMVYGARDVIHEYEWTNPITGETVVQTRHAGEPKYRWPKDIKTNGLVYLARHDREATRPIVWTEGAKAADAAAAKLPVEDYDVIGFASSTVIPSAATLKALTKGRSCIVWPDDDLPGAKVGRKLLSALRQAGADVATVDPARLELTGGDTGTTPQSGILATHRSKNSVRHAANPSPRRPHQYRWTRLSK